MIETALKNMKENKSDIKDIEKKYPQRRLGKPEQVANLTCFLCSKYATFMTGENVTGENEIVSCERKFASNVYIIQGQ